MKTYVRSRKNNRHLTTMLITGALAFLMLLFTGVAAKAETDGTRTEEYAIFDESQTYRIFRDTDRKFCWALYGDIKEKNTPVLLREPSWGEPCDIKLCYMGDGWYTIRFVNSNLYVDTEGNKKDAVDKDLHQYHSDNRKQDNQQFRFVPIRDEKGLRFKIRCKIGKNKDLWASGKYPYVRTEDYSTEWEVIPNRLYDYTFNGGDGVSLGISRYSGNEVNVTVPTYYCDIYNQQNKTTRQVTINYISSYAFACRPDLQHITISEAIKSIGEYAFVDCTGLKEITIPASIDQISEKAFAGCTSLETINFDPNTPVSIGNYAFSGCTSLKKVNIPNCASVEYGAFEGDISLEEITIQGNPRTLSYRICKDCTSLTTVNLPGSLEKINEEAFMNCSSLEHLIIPEGVTYIGKNAFTGCTSLKELRIPESVDFIHREHPFPDDITLIGKSDSYAASYVKFNIKRYSYTFLAEDEEPAVTASLFGNGNITLIIILTAVFVLAFGFAVIFRKKKSQT